MSWKLSKAERKDLQENKLYQKSSKQEIAWQQAKCPACGERYEGMTKCKWPIFFCINNHRFGYCEHGRIVLCQDEEHRHCKPEPCNHKKTLQAACWKCKEAKPCKCR